MYIYVINKDDHCTFQYIIHFVCLIKMNQKNREKTTLIVCAQFCVLYYTENKEDWHINDLCLFEQCAFRT